SLRENIHGALADAGEKIRNRMFLPLRRHQVLGLTLEGLDQGLVTRRNAYRADGCALVGQIAFGAHQEPGADAVHAPDLGAVDLDVARSLEAERAQRSIERVRMVDDPFAAKDKTQQRTAT